MTTPAKERFMLSVHETVNALEVNCLQLSKDVEKFKSKYLTHTLSIMTGMVMRVRRELIVNRVTLINLLPKGVLKHGETKRTESQKRKAARR